MNRKSLSSLDVAFTSHVPRWNGTTIAHTRVQAMAAMLRITTLGSGDELVMKLEGCMEGASVAEVEACWRRSLSQTPRVRVDLIDVCHVDDRGRALMTEMFRAGVRFIARGCVMPELVREISQSVRN